MSRVGPPWRLVVPNLVTGANIAIGFCSILASASGRFELAVRLLVVAIFCDMFDGQLARRLGATSRFGQEMDSLSDALSFGAAPAFLVYQASLVELGPWGVAISVLYLMGGVLRLARFNVTSDVHVKAKKTLGVPIPVAAGYAMAVALMRDRMAPEVAAAVVLTMALLMVSRVRLPQMKGSGLVTATLLVGICNYLAVVVRPSWATVVWWNLWNVVILLAARFSERRERPAEPEAA